ncbi:hypothetical protein [Rheinheimera sp.]|uniref:hypothetical protein n=1 Tax=Rheinheimera sp. TaxID=1869214 RepID=UPI00307F559F
MSPEQISGVSKQQGSSLIVAIFVIVIMGLLVAALSRFLQSSAAAISYEVLGTRAFFAAQTGLEQGLVQLFPVNSTSSYCGMTGSQLSATAPVQSSPASMQLPGCSYSLSCISGRENATATAVVYYQLTSVGTCSAGTVVSERTLSIEVWQ